MDSRESLYNLSAINSAWYFPGQPLSGVYLRKRPFIFSTLQPSLGTTNDCDGSLLFEKGERHESQGENVSLQEYHRITESDAVFTRWGDQDLGDPTLRHAFLRRTPRVPAPLDLERRKLGTSGVRVQTAGWELRLESRKSMCPFINMQVMSAMIFRFY